MIQIAISNVRLLLIPVLNLNCDCTELTEKANERPSEKRLAAIRLHYHKPLSRNRPFSKTVLS